MPPPTARASSAAVAASGPRRAVTVRARSGCGIVHLLALHFLELQTRIAHIPQSLSGVLFEATVNQVSERCGRRRRQAVPIGFTGERIRIISVPCLPRTRDDLSAFRTARNRTPRCRRACRPACLCLFRRHVRGHAENAPDLVEALVMVGTVCGIFAGGFECFRQAKVENLHLPGWCDLDVGRFQIAVNDSLLVRSLQRVRDLTGDRQRFLERDRPARNPVRERLAIHKLQCERPQLSVSSIPWIPGNVRVVQRSKCSRFAVKPCDAPRQTRRSLAGPSTRHRDAASSHALGIPHPLRLPRSTTRSHTGRFGCRRRTA